MSKLIYKHNIYSQSGEDGIIDKLFPQKNLDGVTQEKIKIMRSFLLNLINLYSVCTRETMTIFFSPIPLEAYSLIESSNTLFKFRNSYNRGQKYK